MAAKRLREGDLPDAKAYAGKVKRLALALMRHGEEKEAALGFIASAKGILDADKAGMARWFAENLPKLEGRADYKAICEDCACCLGGKRAEAARAIFLEEATLEGRIRRLLATPLVIGCRGEVVDPRHFTVNFYPEQGYYKCSCLRFEEGKQPCDIPAGYCYCCCGHLKHHIQKALGQPVEVALRSSSLTTHGKEPCRFLVTVLPEESV